MATNQNKGGGARKYGRSKKKAMGRSGALSLYVRGKIDFETYAKQAGIKTRKV